MEGAGEGRAKRQAALVGRGGTKARNALAELAEMRKSGAKRADRFEIKEEAAVYDMVDEDEYAKIVKKRFEDGGAVDRDCAPRRPQPIVPTPIAVPAPAPPARALAAGGFVVGGDDMGYTDIGEEVDWGAPQDEGAAEEDTLAKGKGPAAAGKGAARARRGSCWLVG